MTGSLETFLGGAEVPDAVLTLRPDDRAVLLAADGLDAGPSDAASEEALQHAEAAARDVLRDRPVTEVPHVAAWREAYRAFGAKPQRTRNSLEALMRRAEAGLPRINWLTDLCDEVGVTCRRWNWRQATRTQLHDTTTSALFILDALDPMTDRALQAAADDLAGHLTRLGTDVRVSSRLLAR